MTYRWIVSYKTPISFGRADAVGETREEAETDFRARYRYFSPDLYKVTKIEPLDAVLARGSAI